MNLHVHVARSASAAHVALVAACRRHGLAVAGSRATPVGRAGRGGFVVELADPLPGVPDATPSAATRDASPDQRARHRPRPVHGRDAPAGVRGPAGAPEVAPAARVFETTLRAVLAEVAALPPEPPSA
jgi:hypothetical protein